MTTFYDGSAIPDLQPLRGVLQEISRRAASTGVEVMIVGAAARDLLIRHDLGAPPRRATLDVDIAVAVATWTEVRTLTDGLTAARGGMHTFLVAGMEVDIIPFRGIESTQRTIAWPDDHKMNVFGFQEALNGAVRVKLAPGLNVLVASLPAQALLKLIAWHDGRHVTSRDAIDLGPSSMPTALAGISRTSTPNMRCSSRRTTTIQCLPAPSYRDERRPSC